MSTNEEFIRSLRARLDPNNVKAVFRWAFFQLPPEVRVYPTENYYYFSFYAGGRCYWGNFRLSPGDRDQGILNFVYWEYRDRPEGADRSRMWSKAFDRRDGLMLRMTAPFRYEATYRGRTVTFQLNRLSQRRPRSLVLARDEEYLGRSCDESGFEFFLVYAKRHRHFMWILDGRRYLPDLEKISSGLWHDPLSGFAFFDDKRRRRHILVGVSRANIRRNNYWDGPFDQLPDNFVHPRLKSAIEQAYPHSRGRIDKYGKFTDQPGFRVAITPYLEYSSLGEMTRWVENCRRQPKGEFCACITYDSKKHGR